MCLPLMLQTSASTPHDKVLYIRPLLILKQKSHPNSWDGSYFIRNQLWLKTSLGDLSAGPAFLHPSEDGQQEAKGEDKSP